MFQFVPEASGGAWKQTIGLNSGSIGPIASFLGLVVALLIYALSFC